MLTKTDTANSIICELVAAHPSSTKQQLFSMFLERALNNPDINRAVLYYFFTNNYALIATPKRAPHDGDESRKVRDEKVAAIKGQVVLLAMTMPNGKPMRACTGQDMATFGHRFHKIADRVGKAKTVGEVLSEDDVRALMK